jgi:ABC-type dipeptide/oligopeptide/nickel transport system ATPase subunit
MVLRDLSLKIEPGQIIGIVVPRVGKTTIARAIAVSSSRNRNDKN